MRPQCHLTQLQTTTPQHQLACHAGCWHRLLHGWTVGMIVRRLHAAHWRLHLKVPNKGSHSQAGSSAGRADKEHVTVLTLPPRYGRSPTIGAGPVQDAASGSSSRCSSCSNSGSGSSSDHTSSTRQPTRLKPVHLQPPCGQRFNNTASATARGV